MKVYISAALLLGLMGCATAYQPSGYRGGFSDSQLATDIFRITFQGNAVTTPDRAEEMALLRSAEVAINNGFNYFVIVKEKSRSDVTSISSPTFAYTDKKGNTSFYGGDEETISRPSTTNTIRCFINKPDSNGIIYDAKFLYASLAKKYGVK